MSLLKNVGGRKKTEEEIGIFATPFPGKESFKEFHGRIICKY
jgi:hypothetical protein